MYMYIHIQTYIHSIQFLDIFIGQYSEIFQKAVSVSIDQL